MAGTIVHLAISNEIKKKYNFSDRFLFGSIMPDIRKRICEDRDATHYIEEIYLGNNNIKRLPNLERYIKENKEKIAQKDEYVLGYFAHLVQDRIWFDKYISRFVEFKADTLEVVYMYSEERMVEREYWVKQMYNDYAKLEQYVLDKFNLDKNDIVQRMLMQTSDYKVKETIKSELRDFDIDKKIKREVLTQNQMDEYFEESIKETFDMYRNLGI